MTKLGRPPVPAADRFWPKVNKTDGCWEWEANRHKAGYGKFRVGANTTLAHRWSWEHHFGAVPEGLCVLHECDNPPCVRPDHLFLGTKITNNNDRHAKGRDARGEASGMSKLTVEEVIDIRSRANEKRADLASEFGVSPALISHIINRRIWKQVA